MISKNYLFISVFFFLTSFFLTTSSVAQNLDSLFQVAKSMPDDSKKVDELISIGEEYRDQGESIESIEVTKVALELSEEVNYKLGIGKALSGLGKAERTIKNFEKSIEYLEEALDIYEDLKNEHKIAQALTDLGETFTFKGDYVEARELINEASTYHIDQENFKALARDYFYLGMINNSSGKPDKAIRYYYKAIKLFRDKSVFPNGSFDSLAAAYANTGGIYDGGKEYELAIDYYKKGLDIFPKKNGNKRNKVIMYRSAAEAYLSLNKTQQALRYCEDAQKIAEDFKYSHLLCPTYRLKGAIFFELEEIDSSYYYLNKALNLSIELDYSIQASRIKLAELFFNEGNLTSGHKLLMEVTEDSKGSLSAAVHKLWSQYYDLNGDAQKSLESFKKYITLNDSIVNANRIPAVDLSDTIQEQELQAHEKQVADKNLKEQIDSRNFLQYSGALILIVLLFVILSFSTKLSLNNVILKGGIFLTLLMLFEFILVYSDPYIETITKGEPLYKLGINVCIAALIFPLHTFIEKKMSQRNKKS